MICYSTKNKKHIGLLLNNTDNLHMLETFINEDYVYHIWGCHNKWDYEIMSNFILKCNLENSFYIHIPYDVLNDKIIDYFNKSGVIVSIEYTDSLKNQFYKALLLPKIIKLHIEFHKHESLKSIFEDIEELRIYYNMSNNYNFAFDIDVGNFINVEDDINYFITELKNVEEHHPMRYYFYEFIDKLDYIDNHKFVVDYTLIGYTIENNKVFVYDKNKRMFDVSNFSKVYDELYTQNDVCNECYGFLFCSKIKESFYCLNNRTTYKDFYSVLSTRITEM